MKRTNIVAHKVIKSDDDRDLYRRSKQQMTCINHNNCDFSRGDQGSRALERSSVKGYACHYQ